MFPAGQRKNSDEQPLIDIDRPFWVNGGEKRPKAPKNLASTDEKWVTSILRDPETVGTESYIGYIISRKSTR